jgi:hypothetical protein
MIEKNPSHLAGKTIRLPFRGWLLPEETAASFLFRFTLIHWAGDRNQSRSRNK